MPASIKADASMIRSRQSRALSPSNPFKLTQRLAALPIGVGVNQIVERFGFGQIELAVLERAAGKFAGLRGAHIFKLRERREQRRQHRAPAVNVKLGDVFAGRTCRSRKPEHDRIVDPLPFASRSRTRVAIRGCGTLPAKRLSAGPGPRTGHPHDGDRARRPAR